MRYAVVLAAGLYTITSVVAYKVPLNHAVKAWSPLGPSPSSNRRSFSVKRKGCPLRRYEPRGQLLLSAIADHDRGANHPGCGWSERMKNHSCLERATIWALRNSTADDIEGEEGEDDSIRRLKPSGEDDVLAQRDEPSQSNIGGMRGIMAKLKEYGLAGVIAYGLLNQLFYTVAFTVLWLGPLGAAATAAPATGGIRASLAVSAKQFGKVAGLVWIGSQATKPARAGLALLLSPAAESVLDSTQRRLRLRSRQQAFLLWFFAILTSTVAFCSAAVAYAALRGGAVGSSIESASSAAGIFFFRIRSVKEWRSGGFRSWGMDGGPWLASPSDPDPGTGFSIRSRERRKKTSNACYGVRSSTRDCASGIIGSGVGDEQSQRSDSLLRAAEDPSFSWGAEEAEVSSKNIPAALANMGTTMLRADATNTAAVESSANYDQDRLSVRKPSDIAVRQGDLEASHTSSPSVASVTAGARLGREGESSAVRERRAGSRGGRGRMSPQKAADRYPPPQDNIHGWKERPKHLLGLWEVGKAVALPPPSESHAEEAIAAAAPSIAAAETLAHVESMVSSASLGDDSHESTRNLDVTTTSGVGESYVRGRRPEDGLDGLPSEAVKVGGFSYRETAMRDMIDLGSDVLHHIKYVVFRRDGSLKAGPATSGVAPRSWRFTPANRRIVFEMDVPARGITLRYTGKLTRVPGVFTRAKGIIRVRPTSDAMGDREMPKTSRSWPKLASFTMLLDLPEKFVYGGRSGDDKHGQIDDQP